MVLLLLRNIATVLQCSIRREKTASAGNNELAWADYGVPKMDRRTILAGLGAAAATSSLISPLAAQESPRWGAPVIDMHFHIRRTAELNIAHQKGAGITAANVLTPAD